MFVSSKISDDDISPPRRFTNSSTVTLRFIVLLIVDISLDTTEPPTEHNQKLLYVPINTLHQH